MKVLHLISGGDKGGAKSHVFTLLSGLMRDIDIRVICFMEGVFYQEVQHTGIPYLLIKQRFRYDLTILPKLVRHIRAEGYHLVHAHGARANFIALCLRPFIKLPMITTVHSDYALDFTENLYKKIIFTKINMVALRFLDYYIAVSNSFEEMLVERNFVRDKIYTVYNAIDFSEKITYQPKEQFLKERNIPAGKTLVGIIGRFEKVKGHEVFLRAAANILKTRTDVVFLLAGEGAERKSLEQLTHRLGIERDVIFTGFIKDVYSFINAIDINVLTSYSETFPYVLLEGAKMRKATVSTAVGGIADLVKDGETGFLAASGDSEELADKISQLMQSPELRQRLGENLYEYASTNFSKDSMKNRHLEIYEAVTERHKEEARMFDMVLSGYYGFNNSGDDAILSAVLGSIRREKQNARILILSKRPKETMATHNCYAINRYNFYQLLKHLKKSRVFINGGGNLLQDITSTNSLIYYTTLMHAAKRYGLKVMLYANGIGPLIRPANMQRAKKALKICDYISLREPNSADELKRMGIDDIEISITSDPAFMLTPVDDSRIETIFAEEGIDPGKKYFAITLRAWKYTDPNFIPKMTAVIERIGRTYGLTPMFIPMQQPNDFIISKELVSNIKLDCVLLSRLYKVEETIGIIRRTEFAVAMRLHTLIYAAIVNVPVIGVVYDPKVKAFLDYINTSRYVDIKNIDEGALFEMTKTLMDDIPAAKAALELEFNRLKDLSRSDAKKAVALL